MTNDLPPSVLNISLFGSSVRGDTDLNSDVDVLVVVRDGSGKTPEEGVLRFLGSALTGRPSISWYGENKMTGMFKSGDLFAWHLFLESSAFDPFPDVGHMFGRPADYRTACEDIFELREILLGVGDQARLSPHNAVFELGVLYVCARNIAMSATWHLTPKPYFGRYSPFKIPTIPFSLSMREYDLLVACRMAGQRGISPPPEACQRHALGLHEKLVPWCDDVLREVSVSAKTRK
ncbi:nucleotidyltransferase domain-containing protein [Mesorhizobium sp.]|uniref:nucleotidyltransferase domain-containing protein n=1 Tax=Mesorhizobium sp. TaxID=1871066 RepID=UPI000FD60916|nr:nucleotidyltransferase domain-containing protein [Mesorhizobium sp.]RVC64482.1 hypothetical protein EN779_01705 [Mesorhizobium sp. M4B.F.Ca.ET.088.02.2.1]RWF28352.1 MAG: hypothetical protein EOS45_22710 [Mesorhizobium sp.]